HLIDGEDRAGAAVFRTHVADGGPVGDRNRRDARPGELHERADHPDRTEQFGDGQHQVGGGGPLGQLPGQPDPDHPRDQHGQRLPSIAASASMPPTPQPSTPSPLTIGVCESVPTSVSGKAVPSSANTTLARCSRLTWWQIPVPGGTTRSPGSACCPQRRNAYRSALRRYSRSML